MSNFIHHIFDYLFSFLALDICAWVLGSVALISIILFLRYLFSGGFK